MEMFVLLFLLSIMNISLEISHPLFLGMGLLMLTVLMTGLICKFGSFYSFSLFMVMVGGVLVVFAYTISLIPFREEKGKGDEESEEVKLNWVVKSIIMLVLTVLCSLSFMFIIEDGFSGFGSFSQMFYFTDDWASGMVWIGILLFLVMVFCSNVAGNYEGALCG